jgi:GH25 family lysozyme M1 (1,4-beta-N-acetylmuramidase)
VSRINSSAYVFGLDVSHYQGHINWGHVKKSKHPIKYVFIRSTMGSYAKDKKYKRNWKKAKKHNLIRGAYHYYRPDENSTKQFANFKSVVKLSKGDFPPVLDIEVDSNKGRDYLRKGVKNWLKLAEKHYGVKPIIYTSSNFYKYVLKGHVDGYTLWIADYNGKPRGVSWDFHQFTDRVRVKGIPHYVDGNNYKGSFRSLQALCM